MDGFASFPVTLESRFSDYDHPVLLSGVQALVRVLLEQSRLDRAAGLNTGGLVSGYRGSPLGGVDQELWRREALLSEAGVKFQPGLNEDLAATMLWGAQQLDLYPGKRVDGVFGMWYGKGPGVDRSGDAFRCANTIGTHRHGGVLAVSGDDHVAHSSVFPHTTEGIFESVNIPILQPADVQDIVDFGLAGIALSRFSGLWIALKTIAETAEQHGLATILRDRTFVTPDIPLPPHGLNLDATLPWPAARQSLERRVLEERLPAVRAWMQANRLDRQTLGGAGASIGFVTVGKAHHDLMHALRALGLDHDPAIAVYKVAMTWPLETQGLREFARGKRALIVVEEKRSFVERQIRDTLYNLPADARPAVLGKQDLEGAVLLPEVLELSPELMMPALARVLPGLGVQIAWAPAEPSAPREPGLIARSPMFCAGCPHNTSTKLPDGSYAMAGIGCHTLAVMTSEDTRAFSQMGGEGVPWVGLAPFTALPHLFANMGDGTYQHSGLLAIRQAIAAKAPITYKLLFNDAVAMTGGQPAEGAPTVPRLAAQLHAEGVGKLAIVADDPARLPPADALPPGTIRRGREEMDAVQREMREFPGVSAIIYDQVCATEKRRRRKRGKMAQAETRVLINPDVCENCGDCTVQSNCIAIEPVETDHGRKRRISPTSCNTDLSCLKGFCPSFVTSSAAAPPPVMDHAAMWQAREAELAAALPEPALATGTWRGLFAGIGGGGIVTCGQIVAMAAHLEGRPVSTLDFTGLAQKNGAVVSHVQIGAHDAVLDVVRIPRREADLLLAADLAVGAGADVLGLCRRGAAVIGNLDLQAGAGFLRERDFTVDARFHQRAIERQTGTERALHLHGSAISERLFGTAQAVNTLMLGIAWQRGALPLGEASLTRAIELNGTAVALNHRAFLWGRILATRPALADEILSDLQALPTDLPSVIARREAELVAYGGTGLAQRYRRLVAAAAARETALAGSEGALTRAVAEGFYRALAYKDEYEVARLHAAAEYGEAPTFHMAPPLISGVDKATGRRRKIAIPGRIALPLFRLLRHGKALRGTKFDPFGWQAERRRERAFLAQYEADLTAILPALRRDTLEAAAELARLPLDVRGFGPVKDAGFAATAPRRQAILERLRAPRLEMPHAAE